MSLLCTTLLLLPLLLLLPIALSQFDKPKNANKFVDSVSLIPLFVKFTTVGFADDCTSGERKQLDNPLGGRAVPRRRRPPRLPARARLAGEDS